MDAVRAFESMPKNFEFKMVTYEFCLVVDDSCNRHRNRNDVHRMRAEHMP